MYAGLYLQGFDPGNLGRYSELNVDIYVPGPAADGLLPSPSALRELGEEALGVGLGLPPDDLARAGEILREGRTLYGGGARPGFFLTSAGPLTREIDPQVLRTFASEVLHL